MRGYRRLTRMAAVFGLLIGPARGSVAQAASAGTGDAPRPVARWDAAKATEQTLPELAGGGPEGRLLGVAVMDKVEDLVERPCLFFNGQGAHVEIPDAASLNPDHITLTVWFKPAEGAVHPQWPLVVKSRPKHVKPWYQYGLFLMNANRHPQSLSFYLSVGDKLGLVQAINLDTSFGWHQAVATFDGTTMRLYLDGEEVASKRIDAGTLDRHATPLLIGAYGNLPKRAPTCYEGFISEVAIHAEALSADVVTQRYASQRKAYPASSQRQQAESAYARRVNEALRQRRDVWGEAMIAEGGATYERTKDYLRPLFYSTGVTNKAFGVHNLLFAQDGGEPPYLVPIADGSRIAAGQVSSKRDLTVFVGPDGQEAFGSDLDRLDGPRLEQASYPMLQTGYVARDGVRYTQESFAGRVPGLEHLVAFVKLTAEAGESERASATIRVGVGGPGKTHVRATGSPRWQDQGLRWTLDGAGGKPHAIYLIWSPDKPLPDGAAIDAAGYARAKAGRQAYWDGILAGGARFIVPEPLVMNVQKNHLIQNRIMRWRYALGSVVYHGAFYQPESSDAVTILGEYGFLDAYRDGLAALVGMAKGKGPEYYTNWERGEKLSHGAHYYHLTRDAAFIKEHTPSYLAFCEDFRKQMEVDPHGLLRKERHCGDIPERAYCTFHQTVCWRGLRDMAEVWRLIGRDDLHARYRPLADRLRRSLGEAVARSSTRMPDGSLFVPKTLLDEAKPYDPITETRHGSYWNLVMPYAFASGFWDFGGREMDGIVQFLHEHGAVLLGLIRFNYYPTPIGSYRPNGLPGYCTPGFDNVYLPNYVRVLARRDMAERLIVSFYGKLAHAQTRNTYVSGEGETVGARPGRFYRSCYGTPCSANNSTFLLMLRLMLIRESFTAETGEPEGLFLAHATPREWLADGKRIEVSGAPTCFGPLSYTIESALANGRVRAEVRLPDRDPIKSVRIKFRVPGTKAMASVTVNGEPHDRVDREAGVIDLTGMSGELSMVARYE